MEGQNCRGQILIGVLVLVTAGTVCVSETTMSTEMGRETTLPSASGATVSESDDEDGTVIGTATAPTEAAETPLATAAAPAQTQREEEEGNDQTTAAADTGPQQATGAPRDSDAQLTTTAARAQAQVVTVAQTEEAAVSTAQSSSTTTTPAAASNTTTTVTTTTTRNPGASTPSTTGTTTPRLPINCTLCNGTTECSDVNVNTSTCVSSSGICYVLYHESSDYVKMSCESKETGASCLSEFASRVADGFCEYCCTTERCNDDWTVAHVRDDCRDQSAATTVQHSTLITTTAIFITIFHAMSVHCYTV